MNTAEDLKLSAIRKVNCYHCQQKYQRSELRQFRNGEMLVCKKCVYKRNRRNVKLRKRKV